MKLPKVPNIPVLNLFKAIGKIHKYTTNAVKITKTLELVGRHAKEIEQEGSKIWSKK